MRLIFFQKQPTRSAFSTEQALSTGRLLSSSATFSLFSLARYIATGLIFVVAAGAVAQKTVGERLAADLTWTQVQRDARFAHMDRVFPVHWVHRGASVLGLPRGRNLLPANEITGYMHAEHLAGVLVLVDGAIREERYGLGLTRAGQWTSFSVTKAVTDTLAGVALRNGQLSSLEENIASALPEMSGSAYDSVTVRQLMTMTSGVRWRENYTSLDADNVRLYSTPAPVGMNSTVAYMRALPREVAAGTRWQYNTGETDLLGVVLRRVTGRSLAEQLSEAVWKRAGMQQDAMWIATALGKDGEEFGGSGLSASLRDFGRLGLWVLRGGDGAVPQNWFQQATSAQVRASDASYGYGWWPQQDGAFAARGIFGQSIFIDPQRKLVVVTLGDWESATGAAHSQARADFWRRVQGAVDAESR